MEGKETREEKCSKFSQYLKCIKHYIKDSIHHPGIDQKAEESSA